MTAKTRKTEPKSDPAPEKSSDQLIAEASELIGDIDLSTAPKLNPARALTPGNKLRVKGLVDRYNAFDAESVTESEAADLYDEVTDFIGRCATNKADFEAWLISDQAFEQTFPLFLQLVQTVGELARSSS